MKFKFLLALFLAFFVCRVVYCQTELKEVELLKEELSHRGIFQKDPVYINVELKVFSKFEDDNYRFLIIDQSSNKGMFSRTLIANERAHDFMAYGAVIQLEKNGTFSIDDYVGSAWGGLSEIKKDIFNMLKLKPRFFIMNKTSKTKVSISLPETSENEMLKNAIEDAYENLFTYPDGGVDIHDEKRLVFSTEEKEKIMFVAIRTMPEGVKGNGGFFCEFKIHKNTKLNKPMMFAAFNTDDKLNKTFDIGNYEDYPILSNKEEINKLISQLLVLKPQKALINRSTENKVELSERK